MFTVSTDATSLRLQFVSSKFRSVSSLYLLRCGNAYWKVTSMTYPVLNTARYCQQLPSLLILKTCTLCVIHPSFAIAPLSKHVRRSILWNNIGERKKQKKRSSFIRKCFSTLRIGWDLAIPMKFRIYIGICFDRVIQYMAFRYLRRLNLFFLSRGHILKFLIYWCVR